jgi:RNA-directed DNA polymerase
MTRSTETQPAAVSERAIRAGKAKDPRSWIEPTVWTERMLAALEQGVKGGKWFSLIDKVHPERTLQAAFLQVAANKGAAGVDHVTIEMFAEHLDEDLKRLSDQLRTGTYRPQAIRRHYIPKPGTQEKRPLGIPTIRDRVVQSAVRMVLEPIFEYEFAQQSYGFRPGRGCKDALRRVDELLKSGFTYIVDADLKSYFDTIPHDRLMTLMGQKVSDGRVLNLLEAFLKQGVMDGLREWTPEMGSPQGAVISPLLSNVYLNPLDHLMAQKGYEMVRYADDFVILCRSREEAERALAMVQEWVATASLTLHPTKTRIVNALEEYFDFLGYRFANEEPPEIEGHHPSEDDAEIREMSTSDHRRTESDLARLVWILQAQPSLDVCEFGQMDTDEVTEHPPETAKQKGPRPRIGSSALAKCILRGTRAI